MNLCVFKATNYISTRYSDNQNNLNSVMFLHLNSSELNNYTIHPEQRLSSDHVLLIVDIVSIEKYIQTKKYTIIKNSKEERNFIIEHLLIIQKELGSNTQEMPISQNTQNHSETKSIKRNLKITEFQEFEKIQEYYQEDQMCIF